MKTLLATLLLAACTTAQADPRLIGEWSASTADNGALRGSLTLTKGGSAALHPEGFERANGSWMVADPKKRALRITLENVGTSEMHFSFNKKGQLELTYDNGNVQVFERAKPAEKK